MDSTSGNFNLSTLEVAFLSQREPIQRGPPPDAWTEYIDSRLVWEPLAEILLERPGSVLDLGCGDGHVARELASRGFRVIGVDIQRAVGPQVVARVERLPFQNGAFDLVLLVLVLMHVPGAESTLREIRRVMKRGATLLIAVGNRQSFTGLAAREGSPRFLNERIPYNYYRSYSRRQLRELLAWSGFKVKSIRCVTFVPRFVAKSRPRFLRRILSVAVVVERVIAAVPLVRWCGIRLLAVGEAE